jgi:hypothetical protein
LALSALTGLLVTGLLLAGLLLATLLTWLLPALLLASLLIAVLLHGPISFEWKVESREAANRQGNGYATRGRGAKYPEVWRDEEKCNIGRRLQHRSYRVGSSRASSKRPDLDTRRDA